MAIKVIKQGVKEFHITCPYCGCEFTYENEDVCNSEVICPCCLTNLPHKGVVGTINTIPFPMPIWYNQCGADEGDFGRSRFLKPSEQEKYKKLFSEVIPEDLIDPTLFKYVDYCYYDCCECDDYYVKKDSFEEEI